MFDTVSLLEENTRNARLNRYYGSILAGRALMGVEPWLWTGRGTFGFRRNPKLAGRNNEQRAQLQRITKPTNPEIIIRLVGGYHYE